MDRSLKDTEASIICNCSHNHQVATDSSMHKQSASETTLSPALAALCGRGDRFFLFSGPCVIESEQMALDTAGKLAEITASLIFPLFIRVLSIKQTEARVSPSAGQGLNEAWKS